MPSTMMERGKKFIVLKAQNKMIEVVRIEFDIVNPITQKRDDQKYMICEDKIDDDYMLGYHDEGSYKVVVIKKEDIK